MGSSLACHIHNDSTARPLPGWHNTIYRNWQFHVIILLYIHVCVHTSHACADVIYTALCVYLVSVYLCVCMFMYMYIFDYTHMYSTFIGVYIETLLCFTKQGHRCGGTTERGGQANSLWFPPSYIAALHQGWLWPWEPWVCGKLLPGRLDSNRVLLPRHGRTWGTHWYCCQDQRNR